MSLLDRARTALAKGKGIRVDSDDILELVTLLEVADHALAELREDTTEPEAEEPDAWWWGEHSIAYRDERGILRAGEQSTYDKGTPVDPRYPGEDVPIHPAIAWALSPEYEPSPTDHVLTVHQHRYGMGDYDPELHPTLQPGRRKGPAPDWYVPEGQKSP